MLRWSDPMVYGTKPSVMRHWLTPFSTDYYTTATSWNSKENLCEK